jgi:membrane-anchored protein YejM (alkaline phosphatase superfamily)
VGAWGDICSQVLAAGRKNPDVVLPKLRGLYQRAVERFSELFLPRLADAIACHASDGFLMVVTADHGETWGERQGRPPETVFDLHGNALFDESLRVPLLAWGPAWLHRGCVDGLARTVDLAPTLAEILGAQDVLASDRDGVSLASAWKQGTPPAHRRDSGLRLRRFSLHAPACAALAGRAMDGLCSAQPTLEVPVAA